MMYEIIASIVVESWLVLGRMAPYLLFGFLMAGLLSVCVSPVWVERHLGRRGVRPVLTASLLGVPLPLCSCAVIPVSASIYRHGASRAATTAFLISTPQTGVDSIAITYGLLGPVFAVFRPVAALLAGLVGGMLVQFFGEPGAGKDVDELKSPSCTESCCDAAAPRNVVLRALHYGFVILPRDIGVALLVGILIAGAITALVPVDLLGERGYVGQGTLWSLLMILLMMAVSVPVYVCATASVPIALGLMHVGVPPGAALAFLIAGPATNAATITTVWKILGRRTAVVYLLTVAFSAVACGLLLDGAFPGLKATVPQAGTHAHEIGKAGWLIHSGAVVMLVVLVLSSRAVARLKKGERETAEAQGDTSAAAGEQRLELLITGMTCSHCAESVRRALAECDGVRSAEVDLASGRAIVAGVRLDPGQLVAAVAGLGYTAAVPD